jgi:hypothetical protein
LIVSEWNNFHFALSPFRLSIRVRLSECEEAMGGLFKVIAKIWFFGWDIPAFLALLRGQFAVCAAIILAAAVTGGALWLYGDRLETKAAPSRAAAWRRSKGLNPSWSAIPTASG